MRLRPLLAVAFLVVATLSGISGFFMAHELAQLPAAADTEASAHSTLTDGRSGSEPIDPIRRRTGRNLALAIAFIVAVCTAGVFAISREIVEPLQRTLSELRRLGRDSVGKAPVQPTSQLRRGELQELVELDQALEDLTNHLEHSAVSQEFLEAEVTRRIDAENEVARLAGRLEWANAQSAQRERDIRAEKERAQEAELRERLRSEQLEASNHSLKEFAYVASHDLQEPLRAVTSYLQLLERRYASELDDDAKEFIGFAVDGADRMKRLIRSLLEYSRVSTTGQELTRTNAKQSAEAAIDALRTKIAETGAKVQFGDLPYVMADAAQLQQLLTHLIDNAIKYRSEAPPVISIQAQRSEHDWIFTVEDNGMGIDPKLSDRIFNVFQRLHGHGEFEGTGIGLAICRRIIDRHGGRLWVESKPGEGSSFRFTLLEHRTDATRQASTS